MPQQQPLLATNSFVPSRIAGLALWLSINSLSALANNDPVSTWPDSSGNSRDATGVLTTRPLYKTNILNGYPGVLFDGSDDKMITVAFTQAQPNTYFLVVHSSIAFQIMFDGVTTRQQMWFNTNLNLFAGSSITNNLSSGTKGRVITGKVNGASSVTYENGAVVASGDAGSLSTSGGIMIGDSPAGSVPFAGYFCEFLLYAGALSDDDRKMVERYLGAKYGLVVA